MPVNGLGAEGVVRGVTDADTAEGVLRPAAFCARTLNTYAVPFARPVTVADVVVETPSVYVSQEVPPFAEY